MKKKKVNPLSLDKTTIARLDEKQLEALAGGVNDPEEQDEATCYFLTRNSAELAEAEGECCRTKAS